MMRKAKQLVNRWPMDDETQSELEQAAVAQQAGNATDLPFDLPRYTEARLTLCKGKTRKIKK